MGTSVKFDGTNVVMKAPEGAENVVDVHAFTNNVCCVTCWELTPDEIEEIVKTKRCYVSVFFGGGMPPIFVGDEAAVRDIVADYGVWSKA
jgi:hypothetical protein